MGRIKVSTLDKSIHAALISFKAKAPIRAIKAAARSLAELSEFKYVWIRRVDTTCWGIEFLANCNGRCRLNNGQDISPEVHFWVDHIGNNVSKKLIDKISASGEVVLIKPAAL